MPYSAIRPRRANEVVNFAPAAANRTSHINAWVSPMPAQAPLIAAMTGLRSVATKCGWRSPTSLETSVSPFGVGLLDRRQVAHVGAGAERPARAGDDDRPHVRVGLGPVEQRVELGRQAAAPPVHPLGPVERQHRHPAVAQLVEDRVIGTHRADLLMQLRAWCMHILYTYR